MTSIMSTCAGCGGVLWLERVDITTLGVPGRQYMDGWIEPCENCGCTVPARYAVYQRPELAPDWSRFQGAVFLEVPDGPPPAIPTAPLIRIYAGPPAPYPHVPTHDEFMAAWLGDDGLAGADWKYFLRHPVDPGL